MVTFLPILRCKREINNLRATNGRAGKAIRVGEKNHNAWCIPTLNEMVHGEHKKVNFGLKSYH